MTNAVVGWREKRTFQEASSLYIYTPVSLQISEKMLSTTALSQGPSKPGHLRYERIWYLALAPLDPYYIPGCRICLDNSHNAIK